MDIIKTEPKICNYIDIPLQHINTDLLKAMKRGTSFEKTNALLDKFREKVPDMAIRTTLIVGFPGETDDIFEELKQWVRDQRFDRLGCFTYSHEENTTAFVLEDNIPDEIKQKRVEEIMEIQQQISWEKNQEKVGKVFKCIFDRKEGDYFVGRTEYDSPDVDNTVLVPAKDVYISIGDFANVRITSAEDYDLIGELV